MKFSALLTGLAAVVLGAFQCLPKPDAEPPAEPPVTCDAVLDVHEHDNGTATVHYRGSDGSMTIVRLDAGGKRLRTQVFDAWGRPASTAGACDTPNVGIPTTTTTTQAVTVAPPAPAPAPPPPTTTQPAPPSTTTTQAPPPPPPVTTPDIDATPGSDPLWVWIIVEPPTTTVPPTTTTTEPPGKLTPEGNCCEVEGVQEPESGVDGPGGGGTVEDLIAKANAELAKQGLPPLDQL